MIHFHKESLYLNEVGEDLFEIQGWVNGWPSHVRTKCGLVLENDRKKEGVISQVASNRWRRVDCPNCLATRNTGSCNECTKHGGEDLKA